MKIWPVPNSLSKEIPRMGEAGSFWEERGEGRHCGVDIYAEDGAEVVAIEGGFVIDIGVFTSPDQQEYYLETHFILIKNNNKVIFKYAELGEVLVELGDKVESGQVIGHVGTSLIENESIYKAPFFIRELVSKKQFSKFHLELYKAPVAEVRPYEAGNYLGGFKPESLIDPTMYLNGIAKGIDKAY
jgi:murein DD-endopeptidase MepM/ murein hydrolase activator NlpD